MIRHEAGGLLCYRFEALSALGLNHAVFTRRGGASEGPYASLNLSLSVGDDPERVRANRALVAEAMGLPSLSCARQVHGKEAVVACGGPGEAERHEADILLTAEIGQGLMIKQADCQAVILYEPGRGALANVHCGWRGSVAGVLGEAVTELQKKFGARPAELRAAIAPSLGPCCAQFRDWRRTLPPEFAAFRVNEDHFDFWRLSARQLEAAGVRPEHIEVSGLCTRCSGEFYSYRREGVTGRFATVAALR
jgi:hypothetical protein